MAQQPADVFQVPPELKRLFSYWKIILFVILVILFGFNSVFTVETEEQGVITTFGKYSRTVEPGLKVKLPFIEKVYLVPVTRLEKVEFGFETVSAGIRSETRRGTRDIEIADMLTGDLNLADVEWVVQYRIDNPYNYLFKVRDPKATLRDISEACMRQIVGDRTVNEVITVGRSQVVIEMEEMLQGICREYSLGIKIVQVVLKNVNPPGPVVEAFNAVNEAEQEKETLINKAESEKNKVIPKARGQAEETVQKAIGYATARVNRAEGEATRFTDLYIEYAKAPEVTRRRLYLETMTQVIPLLGTKIITDDKGNNVIPLLQMQLNKDKNEN